MPLFRKRDWLYLRASLLRTTKFACWLMVIMFTAMGILLFTDSVLYRGQTLTAAEAVMGEVMVVIVMIAAYFLFRWRPIAPSEIRLRSLSE